MKQIMDIFVELKDDQNNLKQEPDTTQKEP